MSDVIIRRVRRDGGVDVLGHWSPARQALVLERSGFPLHGPGTHRIEGELPWVFDEIAPDGFLATRFTRWFPELHLPRARQMWSADQVVTAVARRGHDLMGNLVVGDESYARWQRIFDGGRAPGPSRADALAHYPRFVDQILDEPAHSSVGGARPKFALRLDDGSGLIVKFTPPLATETGRRWGDLLLVEALAAETLREAGVSAVSARYLEHEGRGFLEVDRFDRVRGFGRIGHVTLYYLGIARYAEPENAARVVDQLVTDGVLHANDARAFARIHAFSRAIANDDTHLGNYGLTIGDDGEVSLAPAYDVLPMAFAPRHDELPDRRLAMLPGSSGDARELLERLAAKMDGDARLSKTFSESFKRITRL